MLCSISKLSEQELNAIQDLENSLNKSLLAFSCHDIKVADLSADELARIQELENRMGMSLIAVDAA
ncbi:MAG TPA: hypothetical protein VKN73_13830 [Desulfosalsimonadaceae bacterium]|nr:hypothetical protein [Desulfosalsimonadaceae bacterium]